CHALLLTLTPLLLSLPFSSNAPAPTPLYPLSLHDALPIYAVDFASSFPTWPHRWEAFRGALFKGLSYSAIFRPSCRTRRGAWKRSKEHTSELQSLAYLVCRLLLEKKKKKNKT